MADDPINARKAVIFKGNDSKHSISISVHHPKSVSECKQIICSKNGASPKELFWIYNETCYHSSACDMSTPVIYPSLATHSIKSLHFGYKKYAALTKQGQIFIWGEFNKTPSTDSAINPDVENYVQMKPEPLPFKTKDIVCSHGIRRPGQSILATHIALSESKLAAVTDQGRVWMLEGLNEPLFNIPFCDSEPKLIQSLQNRTVVSISAGRDHFCALVLPNTAGHSHPLIPSHKRESENGSTSPPRISQVFSEQIPSISVRSPKLSRESRFGVIESSVYVESCPVCKTDSDFRLSTLMKRAERKRSASVPGDNLSSPEEEEEVCPLGLRYEGLRLELSPSSPDVRSAECSPTHLTAGNHPIKSATLGAPVQSLQLEPIVKKGGKSSEQFSLVSMELLMDELTALKMCSDSSGSTRGEDMNDFSCSSSTSEGSPRKQISPVPDVSNGVTFTRRRKGKQYSKDVSIHPLTEYEVWSWGANYSGQLGLGDTIYRREPALIERLKGNLVTKIELGESHSIALTAAGDIFVWGSNQQGQIKISDNRCVTSPIALKFGTHCTALDIAGEGNMSVFLVSQEQSSTVFYFGKNYDQIEDGIIEPVTVRLSDLEKFGPITNVNCCDEHVIANVDANLADFTSSSLQFAINILKYVNSCIQIHTLGSKLKIEISLKHEETFYLMNSYLCHLWDAILMLANVSQEARENISVNKFDTVHFFHQLANKAFIEKLSKILHQLCNIVSMNGFGCVEFCDSLVSQVDRLCVLHGKESCKIHRRITKLLEFPLEIVQKLIELAKKYDNENLSSSIILWTNFRLEVNSEMDLAEKMRMFWWLNSSTNHLMTLKTASRRFIREYDRYEKDKPNEILNITCNQYKVHWNKFILFSDSLALVEKKNLKHLMFPLVWVKPVRDSNKFILSIVSPEDEFLFEFNNGSSKNQFLQDFNTSLFHYMNKNHQLSLGMGAKASPLLPPVKRKGKHRMSGSNKLWPNAEYDGTWVNGKMHGSGRLIESDGSAYRGRFKDGNLEGFGIRHINRDRKNDEMQQGWWCEGKLNGLAIIRYCDESTYEGYMWDGLRQGHGVHTISRDHSFIGSWMKGVKCGYGVSIAQKGKYLGMWLDDVQHGKGINFNIDGVLHYGHFEKGIFVNGTCSKPDGIECTGEFNGLYMVSGKVTLKFVNGVSMTGVMHGDLNSMNLKITNTNCVGATVERGRTTSNIELHMAFKEFMGHVAHVELGVPAAQKWVDIFDEIFAWENDLDCSKLWNHLVTKLHRLKYMRNLGKSDGCDWDQLEVIPLWSAPSSHQYNQMVTQYFNQAMCCLCHPLSRLVIGLCDIFCASYSGCESHSIIVHSAEFEFNSLIQRTYLIIRRLFPGLPSLDEAQYGYQESRDQEEFIYKSFYDVLQDCMIKRVYPCLHTMYMVYCKELDEKYATKLNVLSSRTDLSLLNFFDADKQLWPIELKGTNVLDTPVICATARSKYYASAIDALQQISCVLSPFDKLNIVIEVFNKIAESMQQYSGVWHNWTADQQVPVVLYVIVRAQVSNLGAEIFLIRNWAHKYIHGQTDQNITALESCYTHLVKEKEF